MSDVSQNEGAQICEIVEACSGLPQLLKAYGDHLKESRTKLSYAEALDLLKEGEGGPIKDEKLMEELIYADDIMKDYENRVTIVKVIRQMGALEEKSTRLLTLLDLKDTLKKDREEFSHHEAQGKVGK
eukprot:Gb_02015 [translate_table: standard]